MTTTLTPVEEAAPQSPEPEQEARVTDASAGEEQEASPTLLSVAAFLATGAAGWMTAGVFAGTLPRILGLLGPAIGAGLVGLSHRTRRPALVQYLVLPAAVLVGAIFVIPDATGGTANLPSLVVEAIRAGGLSQPPVTFDPGWRFLLVVLGAILGAGAASLSTGLNRPRAGVLLALPFIFGAALVQPDSATAVSAIVAVALTIAALSVTFGADLAKEGTVTGRFEARRFGRGAVVLLGMIGALVALSQLGFLLPDTTEEQEVEPMRPQIPPPTPDRELFTVTSPAQVPWRLGVLDVYGTEENAWLTPPFRESRLAEIPGEGTVPLLGNDGGDSSTLLEPPRSGGDTIQVTFRISDMGGRAVPTVANPTRITGDVTLEFDPRTQAVRSNTGRARAGGQYTVVAPRPANTAELTAAPVAGRKLDEFLETPPAPPEVEELLRGAPDTNRFDRLQYVRTQYYANVVAAGAGEPVDVSPARVAEMIRGADASPYEITAGEALLARWAGVPSRIGYGYYGGNAVEGAPSAAGARTYSIRPEHGAMWLEAYFEGSGWVPIVGTPPKAKASISPEDKRNDPTIRPTDELALVVYVPVKLETVRLLFEMVRYWTYRIAPWAVVAVLFVLFYPGLLKLARRSLRRRWADGRGPAARVAAAYTELRDTANDLNAGDPSHTPLEFVDDLAPDDEHRELAWLVTRGLWGDLRRDLRPEDAQVAVDMAHSVARRLRRAHSGLPRIIAFGSRTSLRDPFTDEVPNLWRRRRRLRTRLAPRPAMSAWIVVLALLLTGCAQTTDLDRTAPPSFPDPLVPERIEAFTFVREEALESAYGNAGPIALVDNGRVFTIHEGPEIQGSLQVASFKPGLRGRERTVRDGLVRAIGGGRFRLTRIGRERIHVLTLPEQTLLLWFQPDGRSYQLLVARRVFTRADELFVALLRFQRGEGTTIADEAELIPQFDPRRGIPDKEQP